MTGNKTFAVVGFNYKDTPIDVLEKSVFRRNETCPSTK